MRVFGIVKEAEKEKPIKNAKVNLFVGEQELAMIYTDSKGEFEHNVAESYIGETLIYEIEKEGYKRQKVTYEIDEDEVNLAVELLPAGFVIKEQFSTKKLNWMSPALGLAGGTIAGVVGLLFSRVDPIFLDKVFYGGLMGLGLGLGLKDKEKLLRMVISGAAGFFVGGLICGPFLKGAGKLAVSIIIIIWMGIVGASFGIGLKEGKQLTIKLLIAGLVSGVIANIIATNKPVLLVVSACAISGMSFGTVLGLPKKNKSSEQ
jgi:hypothetical protein